MNFGRKFLCVLAASSHVAGWHAVHNFEYLVTFGDSYSDDGQHSYGSHNVSVTGSQTNKTFGGGYTWTQDLANLTGIINYDYALSGAVCSNDYVSGFPSIFSDEIPLYLQDIESTAYRKVHAANTVYAVWVGTNDLGWKSIFSDSQSMGANLTTVTDCIWNLFDAIYHSGGRHFLLFNQNALQLAPMYQSLSNMGAGDNQYWPNKTLYNTTQYADKMMEYTLTVNTILEYGAPFQLLVKNRWPGASVTVFNVHRLITDIYNNPQAYLESPANVTGFFHHCEPQNTEVCFDAPGSLDSYLW